MITTIMSDFIVSILIIGGVLFGIAMMGPGFRKQALFWLFDSRTSSVELNLYFGMVCLFSIFIYQAFASIIQETPLDISGFGKGIGIIFGGMSISSVCTGLQSKEDPDEEDDEDDPTEQLESSSMRSTFFMKLFNSKDKSIEMHLFMGAIALLGIIFYQGYDLVYISKHWDPEDYGYGLAYAFSGIGAASWSQGAQRKFEKKAKSTKKKTTVKEKGR